MSDNSSNMLSQNQYKQCVSIAKVDTIKAFKEDFKYISEEVKCGATGCNYSIDTEINRKQAKSQHSRDTRVKETLNGMFGNTNNLNYKDIKPWIKAHEVKRALTPVIGPIRRVRTQVVDYMRSVYGYTIRGTADSQIRVLYVKDPVNKDINVPIYLQFNQEQLASIIFEPFFNVWIHVGINERYKELHIFKSLAELLAAISAVITKAYYMGKNYDETVTEDGHLKYIFKLEIDPETLHTKVVKYRYYRKQYIRCDGEHTDFNTNVILGYIGINDLNKSANSKPFLEAFNEEKFKKNMCKAFARQATFKKTTQEDPNYWPLTNEIHIDGRFRCALPISRVNLDNIVSYIFAYFGIHPISDSNGSMTFKCLTYGTEFTQSIAGSGYKSYYNYLVSCFTVSGQTLPLSNAILKNWNADFAAFAMVPNEDVVKNYADELIQTTYERYHNSPIEQCLYGKYIIPMNKRGTVDMTLDYYPSTKLKMAVNDKLQQKTKIVKDSAFFDYINYHQLVDPKAIMSAINTLEICGQLTEGLFNDFKDLGKIKPNALLKDVVCSVVGRLHILEAYDRKLLTELRLEAEEEAPLNLYDNNGEDDIMSLIGDDSEPRQSKYDQCIEAAKSFKTAFVNWFNYICQWEHMTRNNTGNGAVHYSSILKETEKMVNAYAAYIKLLVPEAEFNTSRIYDLYDPKERSEGYGYQLQKIRDITFEYEELDKLGIFRTIKTAGGNTHEFCNVSKKDRSEEEADPLEVFLGSVLKSYDNSPFKVELDKQLVMVGEHLSKNFQTELRTVLESYIKKAIAEKWKEERGNNRFDDEELMNSIQVENSICYNIIKQFDRVSKNIKHGDIRKYAIDVVDNMIAVTYKAFND